MKNIFYVDGLNGTFGIYYKTLDDLPFNYPSGSYNVLKARLFNLPYDKYLNMVKRNYNAKIKGRTGYTVEFFLKKEDAEALAKELNKRVNLALSEWEKFNKPK